MIEYIISLIGSFLPIWENYMLPIVAAAFLATVPCIIRNIIIRR